MAQTEDVMFGNNLLVNSRGHKEFEVISDAYYGTVNADNSRLYTTGHDYCANTDDETDRLVSVNTPSSGRSLNSQSGTYS